MAWHINSESKSMLTLDSEQWQKKQLLAHCAIPFGFLLRTSKGIVQGSHLLKWPATWHNK